MKFKAEVNDTPRHWLGDPFSVQVYLSYLERELLSHYRLENAKSAADYKHQWRNWVVYVKPRRYNIIFNIFYISEMASEFKC
jgi:hypothetical protein